MTKTYYRNTLAVMADLGTNWRWPTMQVRLPDGDNKRFSELTDQDLVEIRAAAQ